jgi:glycosyltransferase involved in cell wall biosynthesis
VDLEKETGGVANIVRQICLLLRVKGYKVTLICSNTELGKVVANPASFVSPQGISVFVVAQYTMPLLGPRCNILNALISAMSESADTQAVAHIHTCFSRLTESAMGFFTKNKVPFVFSPHGKLSLNMLGRRKYAKLLWWKFIARKNIQSANYIGLTAKDESAAFEELSLLNKTKIIPNGFSFYLDVDCLTPELPDRYILYLGYLDPRKQPDFLVRAFALTEASRTHKLLFVGPDGYNFGAVITSVATRENLGDKVILFGPAYGGLKWRILRDASCLCLPSLGEGHPVVLCEALGAGLPSVYSSHCNFSEVSTEGAGIEIDGFSEQIWADAIDRAVLDSALHESMVSAAFRLSLSYTWVAAVDKWESLYFQIGGVVE